MLVNSSIIAESNISPQAWELTLLALLILALVRLLVMLLLLDWWPNKIMELGPLLTLLKEDFSMSQS